MYFLKKISDTLIATERFLADSAPLGDVKRIRSDNGTEFMSKEFKALLTKNRIRHETSASYSPQFCFAFQYTKIPTDLDSNPPPP